jgi:ketosteroid isomerase-like protein
MPIARLSLAIPALIFAGGCSSPSTRFDAAAEADKLLKRDAEWADAAAAGKDVDKIVSYWADDAVVIPQGQPVAEGKEAIRAFVAGSLQIPGFHIHWASDKVSFSPDGQLAYMRSTNEMTVPGPGGAPMTLPGRGISVWRREADGQWRCVVDIWNDPPAAAASAKPATE